MVTFLFWNVNKKSLQDSISRIAYDYDVDIIILAESMIPDIDLLDCLFSISQTQYQSCPSFCEKVRIYSRFPETNLTPIQESDRLTIRKLAIPNHINILLAAVHYPSKLFWSDESQAMECARLARLISTTEQKVGHSRTVLVGDFNMNPFEVGVISAIGLQSVMSRLVARRGDRIVQGRSYPYFYNPMWGFFGDNTPGPPGTYYYSSSEHKVFFWNVFDQVMVRPELIDRLPADSIEIIDSDGIHQLLTPNGIPDRDRFSDHLPLIFQINLTLRGD